MIFGVLRGGVVPELLDMVIYIHIYGGFYKPTPPPLKRQQSDKKNVNSHISKVTGTIPTKLIYDLECVRGFSGR